jgi:uncharacterized protein YbjT (DUF2867 family)
MAARAIFITGATGKQGGSVVNALLKSKAPFEILALTRDAQSSSAQSLAKKSSSIKIITGNLDSIEEAFKKAKEATNLPIWGVFSVQLPMGGGQNAESEERQGKALIDASIDNGVKHFIYSSVDRGGEKKSDVDPTNIPHFISKHNIERHLFAATKGKDMTWTVLRTVAFFENLVPEFFGKVFSTSWKMTLKPKQKLQLIATSDIGFFAAEAFSKPTSAEFNNTCLSIAGDEMTFDEFKSTFEQTTGEKLPTTYTVIAAPINWMVKELGYMFKWFRNVGFGANIEECRRLNPELKDFKTWLETESVWKKG